MITISKNNKRIEETLNTFKNVVLEPTHITGQLRGHISTEENDKLLLEFYNKVGCENYQLHVSHKLINDMPFNQTIDLSFMDKNPSVSRHIIRKNKYTAADYSKFDEYGRTWIPLIAFDEDIVVPMVEENGLGWMAPVLFEEATMRPCVERAHGHVLVVGLGIGFFPFNILLKENVEKVTIIEYNKDIIDLFKEHILPQFPRKDDVEIIHGNAYDYLNNDYINQYDYTFVDIWRNNEDGVYLLSNCLKNIDLDKELSIDFWIEEAILEEVKRGFRIYLYQLHRGALSRLLTGKISDVRDSEDFITLDKIHRYFKDKKIKIKTNADLMQITNDRKLLLDMLKSF